MGRRASLAWLIAVIAGIFMVVPTLASAQEQGSTETDSTLTDEVAGDEETTTEDPATETPPAEPPTDAVAPAEPTEPAPVEEPAAPADSAGFDGSVDTSKAPEPEASSAPASAPAEAAAPEPESADVAAVEAEATSSPGNGGSGRAASAKRVGSDSGDLAATKSTGDSKDGAGCAARGGAGEIHNTFPDDGSCVQSQFEGGLPTDDDGVSDLSITFNGNTITFDIWEDPEGTVNFTVLSGGPFTGAFYVKGGPLHNQCVFTAVTGGSCLVPNNNSGNQAGFSHLDVCVGENPPPPPPPDIPETPETPPADQDQPPEEDVLTEEEREQREEQREEELEEEAVPPAVPTAVTPAPEEALPFTGLEPGWLVLLSLGLLGSGVLLRRKVS